MHELIFIVEEAPEGGFTARRSAPQFSPKRMSGASFKPRFATRCSATSMRAKRPRSSGSITCVRMCSPYEAPTGPFG